MEEPRTSRRLLSYVATLTVALGCLLAIVTLRTGQEPAVSGDDGSFFVELGGVAGVTPQQEARAEKLLSSTRKSLVRFAETSDALKAGYLPVGDGDSGYEHYYKWSYLKDDRVLDPQAPESLMYEVDFFTGERTLAAAAYILQGYTIDTLDQAPDVGGPLTQWHVHLDMCYDRDPFTFGSATLRGPISLLGGKCDPGFIIPTQTMMHVWVVPFDCGPFAALHGISAGQVAKGEEQMCTHEHGPSEASS